MTPREERIARIAEYDQRLGPVCGVALLPLFRAYRRPCETFTAWATRQGLYEAMIEAEWNQLAAAKLLADTQRVIHYELKRHKATADLITTAIRGQAS